MMVNRPRILILTVLLICAALPQQLARALDVALSNLNSSNTRYRDITGQVFGTNFINTYSYDNAGTAVTIDADTAPYLNLVINATGLKPNFAYQIKLTGHPSHSYSGASADDIGNERLGKLGRWYRAQPNAGNSNDAEYDANKNNPNYKFFGYLIIGFFVTDEYGNATDVHIAGGNSYHVLWRTDQRNPGVYDGQPQPEPVNVTLGNPAYDASVQSTVKLLYGEWEPTRATPGNLEMTPGHYICDLAFSEESFHDQSTYAGNWTTVLAAPVAFDIKPVPKIVWPQPSDIVYPQALTAAELDASVDIPGASGKFTYDPPIGTILNVGGAQKLNVSFVPDDPAKYLTPKPLSVTLNVLKGGAVISWTVPSGFLARDVLDGTVLNATADLPGTFDYLPASGTVLQAGLKQTLNAKFTPLDTTNFAVQQVTRVIDVFDRLDFVSGPLSSANPATVGIAVNFSAAFNGGNLSGITVNWSFGDGAPGVNGLTANHTFMASGLYAITVTAHHAASGQTVTGQLMLKVYAPGFDPIDTDKDGVVNSLDADDDNDGFPDVIENAFGTSRIDANVTPFGSRPAGLPQMLKLTRARAITGGGMLLQLSIPVPGKYALYDHTLAFSVAGVVLTFTPDYLGQGVNANGSGIALAARGSGARITCVVKISLSAADANAVKAALAPNANAGSVVRTPLRVEFYSTESWARGVSTFAFIK